MLEKSAILPQLLVIEFRSMTSFKYVFRIFEFGSYRLKSANEIPLNEQHVFNLLQTVVSERTAADFALFKE